MAAASVRPATVQDVSEIVRIQLVTWRTAYAQLLPPAALSALDEDAAGQVWSAAVGQDGGHHVLVATEGGYTVGFCAVGPSSAEDVSGADGGLPGDAASTATVSVLVVEPRWGRRGHGGRLLAQAAQRVAAQGATRGITWVPARDVASTAFYARAGWQPDGTMRTLDAVGTPLRELRLSGPLGVALQPP